jgi:hypothetical protein
MTGQTVIINGSGSRSVAHRIIDAAPAGSVLNVKAPKRTLDQNAKFWAMLSDVSRAAPLGKKHPPETWKALFMNACGYAVQFETGLSGEPFPIGFRSSRLTKQQMSELIEFILAWGSENGVAWSDETRAAA